MPRASRQRGPIRFAWRNPTARSRGPRYLQQMLGEPKETDNIPRPESYVGTRVDGPSLRLVLANVNEPEWRVFWALITYGIMPDEPEGFEYQASIGGGHRLGGNAPDFLLPGLDLAFDMQGIHFHYGTTEKQGSDTALLIRLASQDIQLIRIDETDAMQRPRGVVAAALRREDWSRAARS